jgi:hypothetical protein
MSAAVRVRALRRSAARVLIAAAPLVGAAPAVQAQTASPDIVLDDAAACPSRAGFAFTGDVSGKTYAGIASRGADSFLGRVYYSFSVDDQSRTWHAAGTFYLYGFECRLGTWLTVGILTPPMDRVEYTEYPLYADAGCGGSGGYQFITQPAEDPGGEDPGACYGGGSGGGDPYPGDGGGGGGGGGGGSPVCAELLLDPGCYDVYIDGMYDSTICC